MTQWSYKVLDYLEDIGQWQWTDDLYHGQKPEQVLNALGVEGWELVSAIALSLPDSSQEPGQTTNIQFTLKRPDF